MAYKFELVEGSKKQISILFKLLLEREFPISHENVPDYKTHEDFVINNPYFKWFLVKSGDKFIGSFYLKEDNSIGLNLNVITYESVRACIDFINNKYCPQKAKASMVSKYFYINVAPENNKLIEVMKSLNMKPLQISFRL